MDKAEKQQLPVNQRTFKFNSYRITGQVPT